MKPNPHIADASDYTTLWAKHMPNPTTELYDLKTFRQSLAQELIAKMPEKKDTSYMDTPYGVNNGKDAMVAQNNGYNQALDDVTKIIKDYFGVSNG